MPNQTYIITGASSGIGAATARLCAERGANVVLGARRENLLQDLSSEIIKNGGKAAYLAGDVGDEAYAAELINYALRTFGRLDGAFNNAGMVGTLNPLEDMPKANWDEVLSTNLTSAFLCAKAQVPALKETQGSLLFTSSFVGNTNGGMPGMAAYAAAKAGLIGLVKSLAADLGAHQVQVNALLPGGTKTPMAGEDAQAHDTIAELHALKRMASPDEIAKVAAFLLSKDASFMTGAAVLADGGISARLM